MKKSLCVLLAAAILVLCLAPAMAANIRGINPGMSLYVKTSGGNLNLREGPAATYNKIYRIPYAAEVIALSDYQNGYLQVSYTDTKGTHTGYVDIKYLSTTKVNPQPTVKPTTAPEKEETVSSLNFRSFKLVADGTTYIVAAKPSRVGGFVNLSWAPSTNASVIERMYAGEQMTVICEGTKWLQVQCADGYVGFIMKTFTSVVYNGDTATWEAQQAAEAATVATATNAQ